MNNEQTKLWLTQALLLRIVLRYVTVEPWLLAIVLSIEPSAARNRADRLRKRHLLKRVPALDGNAYRLTETALELEEIPSDSAEPHTASDLAVCRYVFESEKRRRRYTPAELRECFSAFSVPERFFTAYPFCGDADKMGLTCIRVPEGNDRQAIERLEAERMEFDRAPFRGLAKQGAFRLVVVTTDAARASALRAGLPRSNGVPVEFVVIPLEREVAK